MKTYKSIYGIDVSKDTLDLVVLGSAKSCAQQIPNEEASIQEWVATLDQSESLCILEYTGTYSARILYHLCQNGIAVKVVTPSQSRRFCKCPGDYFKE